MVLSRIYRTTNETRLRDITERNNRTPPVCTIYDKRWIAGKRKMKIGSAHCRNII
ncbi:hypothetical protein WH47_02516 [Habropoda laboriosa]|uniref:Uncharacterized protein n=1 Tax=Habropoda laboriosa TaxID=597456 RepID=A0A0L7QW04_9HYME|nr:hypothetical protein WH47_02516 [Habropoda laboriosa]